MGGYCILSRVDSQCCVAFRRTAPDSLPLFYHQARTVAARAARRARAAVCLRVAARVCVHGERALSVRLRVAARACVTLPRPRRASGSRVCVLCPCVCVCFVNKVICGVFFGFRI